MRVLEPWVAAPLQTFIAESSARLILLMTTSGQVVAQHARALDPLRPRGEVAGHAQAASKKKSSPPGAARHGRQQRGLAQRMG